MIVKSLYSGFALSCDSCYQSEDFRGFENVDTDDFFVVVSTAKTLGWGISKNSVSEMSIRTLLKIWDHQIDK